MKFVGNGIAFEPREGFFNRASVPNAVEFYHKKILFHGLLKRLGLRV
jgi:hypothetical protein